MLCNGFFKHFHVFFQVFQTHVSSVSSVSRRMLQMFYRDGSKVDRVLHLSPRFMLPRLDVSSSRHQLGICHPLPLFSMLVTFGAARARMGARNLNAGEVCDGASSA
jgi:hypothetical protein